MKHLTAVIVCFLSLVCANLWAESYTTLQVARLYSSNNNNGNECLVGLMVINANTSSERSVIVNTLDGTKKSPARNLVTLKSGERIVGLYRYAQTAYSDAGSGPSGGGLLVGGNYVLSSPQNLPDTSLRWFHIDQVPAYYDWYRAKWTFTKNPSGVPYTKDSAYAAAKASLLLNSARPLFYNKIKSSLMFSTIVNETVFTPDIVPVGPMGASMEGLTIQPIGYNEDKTGVVKLSSVSDSTYSGYFQRISNPARYFAYYDSDKSNAAKPHWDPLSADPAQRDFSTTHHPRYIFTCEDNNNDADYNEAMVIVYVTPRATSAGSTTITSRVVPNQGHGAWFSTSPDKVINLKVP
jgi:hypothetical protein